MTKEELRQIITGNTSSSLDKKLIEWINSGRMDSELSKMIEADLEHSFSNPAIADKDANALEEIILKKANAVPQNKKPQPSGRLTKSFKIPNLLRIAAVISFFAAVSYVIFYFSQDDTTPSNSIQLVTKENSKGRKSTIFLNDGTVINLNSESRISYPEVFGDSIREVTLEGEAFFEVARNERHPFVIHTGDINLTVLGTSFNVMAFHDTENIKISMNTGKVAVSSKQKITVEGEIIELTAGESIIYSKKTKSFSSVKAMESELDFGWKDGKMVFKNASMEEIFSRCERWYDVKFKVQNKANFKWKYTGEFQNQTLMDVMESLSFSQNFTYKIDKNTISVSFN